MTMHLIARVAQLITAQAVSTRIHPGVPVSPIRSLWRIVLGGLLFLLASRPCAHASHIKTTQETGSRGGTYLRYSPKGYALDYFRPGDEINIHYAYKTPKGARRREYWCVSGTTKYGQHYDGVWVPKRYVKKTAEDALNDGKCKFNKLGSPPCIDPIFGQTHTDLWSATNDASVPHFGWVVEFGNGNVSFAGKDRFFSVQAVRAGS